MTVHPAILAALQSHPPSDEQRSAIEHPPTPLAIIAGAGSGKTAVMAARIAHFIAEGIARPSQILGLTFTNKAAQELEERVRAATEPLALDPGDEPSVFTYHSFADRLLRDFGPKIGLEPEVALLSEAQAHMIVARLLGELTFERLAVSWLPGLIRNVRGLADACANHLLMPEEVVAADDELRARYRAQNKKIQGKVEEALDLRPDYCKAVRAYIDRKMELARIDYGDQIQFAFRIVARRPEVAAALRRRWPFVLLDEYQDTNVAQQRMMAAIYPPGSAITVVGDPDQAIYAWRGATLYNILNFADHFPTESGQRAQTKSLEVSFRSGARILKAADEVIARVDPSRRGGEKVLRHFPTTGDGDVTCDLVATDDDEANLIATEIERLAGPKGAGLAGSEVPYDEVAILCRKRRLFGKIQQALRSNGIPVEVVGLGGLLTSPEVIDLLAYLRLIRTPGDNIAFARIAQGPRWRVSYRDLAGLARWAAVNTSEFRRALERREEDGERAPKKEVDPGEERFSLSEALARIDEVPDLSDEARTRLSNLHRELEKMREKTKGTTVAEAVEAVLGASGIEDHLLATGTPVAQAAIANVGAFLDQAAQFSPLEGQPSLEAFLDYVDAAQDVEDLEVAQPQQQNAVKLMTIHQAKGLEFDLVFVPGMAERIFPDTKVSDNPTRSAATLPFWAREDRKYLPEFDLVMSSFEAELKERAEEEERRLAYVAFTRARRALRLTAAHWYWGDRERKHPNGPGLFFLELAGAPATESSPEMPPNPAVSVRRYEPCPDVNPLRAQLEERAKEWPPSDGLPPDPLFDSGWRRAAEEAVADPDLVDRVAAAKGVSADEFERAKDEVARQLELVTAPAPPAKPDERLKTLSVSSIVQFARCPKQFYWTVVRPLPRRTSAASRVGQEIHRWIELRSIGQKRLDDPEEAPDLTPEELGDELHDGEAHRSPERLKKTFEDSPFAALRPRHVEQPFVIFLDGGFLVRGRIDAIYVHPDGTWELVDYKTGAEPDDDDEIADLQLAIYALAARQIWGVEPTRLKVTYLYLQTGSARTIAGADLTLLESDLIEMFKAVENQQFGPTPSHVCHSCDFLRFCDAGRRFVASGATSLDASIARQR